MKICIIIYLFTRRSNYGTFPNHVDHITQYIWFRILHLIVVHFLTILDHQTMKDALHS